MKLFHGLVLLIVLFGLVSCETTPTFLTVTIFDSPERVVRLQAISDANHGKGFSHPIEFSTELMEELLRGVFVEIDDTSLPLLNLGTSADRRRMFSDQEVDFFAPLFVKGLSRATPEEVVTFFETADISSLHRLTTSGGIFVQGDELHILLSNYNVKTDIWQDSDEYQAPFRLRPLDPIDPEPGHLEFEPKRYMIPSPDLSFADAINGNPWHIAIRYGEIKEKGL